MGCASSKSVDKENKRPDRSPEKSKRAKTGKWCDKRGHVVVCLIFHYFGARIFNCVMQKFGPYKKKNLTNH